MFLVEWFFRFAVWTDPYYRNWLFPADGWVVEQLSQEMERQRLREKLRREAADAQMQRLMYEQTAFGLQYAAPALKAVVELLAPKGVEEQAGQAVAEIRDLAGGCRCFCLILIKRQRAHENSTVISFKYHRDHIEPVDYYRYRRRFYAHCFRRIARAGLTAAKDFLSR